MFAAYSQMIQQTQIKQMWENVIVECKWVCTGVHCITSALSISEIFFKRVGGKVSF